MSFCKGSPVVVHCLTQLWSYGLLHGSRSRIIILALNHLLMYYSDFDLIQSSRRSSLLAFLKGTGSVYSFSSLNGNVPCLSLSKHVCYWMTPLQVWYNMHARSSRFIDVGGFFWSWKPLWVVTSWRMMWADANTDRIPHRKVLTLLGLKRHIFTKMVHCEKSLRTTSLKDNAAALMWGT